MGEHEQTGDTDGPRSDVDAPCDTVAINTRLDDPQRHRTKGGGEQRDGSKPHDRIWILGQTEEDDSTLEQPAEPLGRTVDEQGCNEHQEDQPVGAHDGDAATQCRARLSPSTAHIDWREARLGPPRDEEYPEADHRQAGDHDRDRERRGPHRRVENDDPECGAQQVPARLRRKHAVDQVRPVELVG